MEVKTQDKEKDVDETLELLLEAHKGILSILKDGPLAHKMIATQMIHILNEKCRDYMLMIHEGHDLSVDQIVECGEESTDSRTKELKEKTSKIMTVMKEQEKEIKEKCPLPAKKTATQAKRKRMKKLKNRRMMD